MKKIISMAVMLYITMTAMAQKGELAMNENIRLAYDTVDEGIYEFNPKADPEHFCRHLQKIEQRKKLLPWGRNQKLHLYSTYMERFRQLNRCLKRNII